MGVFVERIRFSLLECMRKRRKCQMTKFGRNIPWRDSAHHCAFLGPQLRRQRKNCLFCMMFEVTIVVVSVDDRSSKFRRLRIHSIYPGKAHLLITLHLTIWCLYSLTSVLGVMNYRNPSQILDSLRIMSNLLQSEKPWQSKSTEVWENVVNMINKCDSFKGRLLNYN
jgi:hypothetical protein